MSTRDLSKPKRDAKKTSGRRAAKTQIRAESSPLPRPTPPRLRPLVGEPWPDEIRVEREEPLHPDTESAKNTIIIGLAILFGGLLVALTIYAMLHGNQATLDHVLQVDQFGLVYIAVWATGKAALKVLSGWKGA